MELASLPRRRRLTPNARRAELLRAGERVFTEAAYEDVSIEQIAEAAGVSKNLLDHYFGGKRDLYLETIRAATKEIMWLEHPAPAREDLREMLAHQFVAILAASARTNPL
jgi:AcrR family transcriptional regulator